MIFFWSDTHFNHAGIIRYCSRPYGSVAEMNVELIKRWNSVVRQSDTVWLLGDFAFSVSGGDDLSEIFSMLHGHKHLIVGNHDERNPKVMKLGWESVALLRTVKDHGMRAEVCHYPLETWKKADGGALMLHGHSHGTLKRVVPHRCDVGCDVQRVPVSFEDLWATAQSQTLEAADHHGDL